LNMPLPLLAQLGIAGGMGLVNYFTGKKNKVKNPYEDPSKYRDDLLQTPQSIQMMRDQAKQNINSSTMATQQNIKQAGAANRMPAGAVLSNLAGTQYGAARGLAQIEPELQQQKRAATLQYIGLQNQFNQGQQETDELNQRNRGLIGDTLGSLAKLAILYNSGYFDSNEEVSAGAGGNPDQYSGIGVQLKNFPKLGR
jgi:hypothetical protein